jgi:phosphoenolpyruvate carboxylase
MRLHRRDIQRDIRELGSMLGETIEAQESRDAFETVESLRQQSIDRRNGEGDIGSVRAELEGLDTDRELVTARAFTTYFELINLAEERERVRALREQSQAGIPDDGLEAAVDALAGEGPETIESVLEDVHIEPTFTAHPTEARRKSIKAKLRSVAASIETLDERLMTDKEAEQVDRDLRAEVTGLWQTPQIRKRQPEPTDEALNVQWYLENTLFDVVGEIYEELGDALAARSAFGSDRHVPKLFEFRSWAGSDRDGNPFVTPAVTAETLSRQRRVVLEKYREELTRLSGMLSQDTDHVEVGMAVDERLSHHENVLPSIAATAEQDYPDEPYRQLLRLMRERLDRVGTVRPGEYDGADELQADLEAIAEDLRANRAGDVAAAHVDPIRRQVETFGFTLAGLDLRDHRENHTVALEEALAREGIDYAGMDESERVEFLTDAIEEDETILPFEDLEELDETAGRVLTRFDRLAEWQREYGTDAVDAYCISMCEEPSHVLEVLFLADQVDVVDLPGHSGIDVVPLLETEYALSGARRIIGTLFENDAYAAALSARDGTQEVMLGYSDSCKENGFFAAQWSLQRNQKRLAEICADYGVELRLFHGRGGSISRGGGPMNDALLSLPNETVTGEVKFTEQGEVIAEKYANPRIAERELEQMLNAQLRARKRAIEQPTEPVEDEWIEAMETGATAAREAYRALLETDGFVPFFEQATPITVIEDLNLGSRPASRSDERSVEDLRAIPWVFAWTQARCIIPGWYSLATGLDAYLDDGGDIETLAEMYDSWPFFRTMLDNAAMALAKTDMTIATEYAALAEDDLADRIFPRIRREYERTIELIGAITGGDPLPLSGWFEESLRRRNPYVDPLNLLQLRLLAEPDRSAAQERALRMTVKGIAAGMKNTG